MHKTHWHTFSLGLLAHTLVACGGGPPAPDGQGDTTGQVVAGEGRLPGDCGNRIDDDADGLFDCEDPGCAGDASCGGSAPTGSTATGSAATGSAATGATATGGGSGTTTGTTTTGTTTTGTTTTGTTTTGTTGGGASSGGGDGNSGGTAAVAGSGTNPAGGAGAGGAGAGGADSACNTTTSISGTLDFNVGSGVANVDFDSAEVWIGHKRDVDAVEDGCIVTAGVFLNKGTGCRLEIAATGSKTPSGGIRAWTTHFVADSQCPGFLDADEGDFWWSDETSQISVTVAPDNVPDANVAESCLPTATLTIHFENLTGNPLTVAPSDIVVTGAYTSLSRLAVGRGCGDTCTIYARTNSDDVDEIAACAPVQECVADIECGTGSCEDDVCISTRPCSISSQECSPGQACVNSVCGPPLTSGCNAHYQCGIDNYCDVDGTCLPRAQGDCPDDLACVYSRQYGDYYCIEPHEEIDDVGLFCTP